jgi:glyoxylase-like metal-dependent hydrolase (beta-lactamase superfamily II)
MITRRTPDVGGAGESGKRTARKFGVYRNAAIYRPYILLKDNDEIKVGEIVVRAVESPGHTPGSMSYVIDGKYLFAGDALRLIGGKVRPLIRFINMDHAMCLNSIKKLAGLSRIEMILTCHRGYCRDFNGAMEKWK